MKITALVENRSDCELDAQHGLSLYIETAKHKILFDVGPGDILFKNCATRHIDLTQVDTVILSHGHGDHGGGLEQFLAVNQTAKIYAQRKAFEKHYSKFLFMKIDVGVDPQLQTREQMILLDGDHTIDEELTLFTVPDTSRFRSSANDALFSEAGKDDFSHEQNLLIAEETKALIVGCGHAGIVNILEKAAPYQPRVCVGGYHLYNPMTKRTVPNELLAGIAPELAKHDTRYYTCHCTGPAAYAYLAERVPDMHYLSCGETIEL